MNIKRNTTTKNNTIKRVFFAPVYKTAKACLHVNKFGNPLNHGYNSCQMVGENAGRLFHFGGENGIVLSFEEHNPSLT